MPELPEVETVRRTLQDKLAGCRITGAGVHRPEVIGTPGPAEFKAKIRGKEILRLDRRGKYLLVHLSGGFSVVIHLRMTGRLIYTRPVPPEKHTHLVLYLDNGRELHFADVRRFGRVSLIPTRELGAVPGLAKLGLEPLSREFDREFLARELGRRRGRLKSLLLDQTFIAGLGNIYVDEALHLARIHPLRAACSLDEREVDALCRAIKTVLREGIKHRGTSMRDYVDGEGRAGNYQEKLRVYGREGQPCLSCGAAVRRIKVGGRSSYFCPRCQKEDK